MNQEIEIINVEGKNKTAYFFQRMGAYLIDIILVSIVVTFILLPIPENKNLTKLNNELVELNEQYIEESLTTEEYINKSIDVSYDLAYESVIPTIIELGIIILYFIVFQFYNKGQTLGKKLLHIRVVKNDGTNLTMNDMIIRGLISVSILINMVLLAFVLFTNETVYFYASNGLALLQSGIFIITLIMIMFRKDGRSIHDFVSKTKVISEK